MTATAPPFRQVCQLTGEKAEPTQFFRALSEADNFCAERTETAVELERLREENASLRARVDELEAELAWHTAPESSAAVDSETAAAARPAPVNPPGWCGPSK